MVCSDTQNKLFTRSGNVGISTGTKIIHSQQTECEKARVSVEIKIVEIW